MAVEAWHDYLTRQLRPVLEVLTARPVQHRKEGTPAAVPVPGTLEWTLPWPMDDGNGLVRVTVFTEIVPPPHGRRVRVVVAAVARGFLEDGGRLTLPRYWPTDPPPTPTPEVSTPDRELTWSMAAHLCRTLDGLPETLTEEPTGEAGFSLRPPETPL
ncbi:hypothetical protein IAG44_37335 [Streptomyces roseirectus]|uniref:Uncharacterized protein n=1 Tax=Streptomyces roseirectus TaxID=2768066 RepID=A0A7H0IP49_9ACTN|nr:hypothetical protein [Streptomyces roseirectus]QNP74565.1 hypothetical protein IAG44_37335 [Streptomyces roseirectus]